MSWWRPWAVIKYRQVSAIIARSKAMRPPPVAVASATGTEQVWQRQLHAVGSLAAVEGVTVSNELAGMVKEIAFESGAAVKKGDLLVKLDIAPDEAQLRGLEAQATLARINLERAQDLRRNNTNAQADLDAAEAQYEQAVATVDNLKGDHRQEGHHRAVFGAAGHPPGRSRPVSGRRHADRLAAGAGSDLRQFLAAPAGSWSIFRSARRCR